MPGLSRNASHTHANLPISLWKSISLTLALFYLQVIYAVSFMARPFWSSHLDFPPFRQAIESAEKFAIDIILDIVPTSQYRSPAQTNQNEDFISRRLAMGLHNRSNPALEPSPHFVSSNSVHAVPPVVPHCYPELRNLPLAAVSPNQKEVQTETMRSTQTTRFQTKTGPGDSGASIYGTARKVSTSTRPKLPATFNETQRQQATHPAESGPNVENGAPKGSAGPHTSTTTVTKEEEHQEEQLTVHIVEISQPADSPSLDISQPTAPVMDMPRPTVTVNESPADSFDGPGEIQPTSELQSGSSRYTDESSSLSLDARRAAKSHSTESYPGKFPVSDGMEYSSLATAEYNFRERGTTSVRPFSDY